MPYKDLEKRRKCTNKWRLENPERSRQISKEYYQRNKKKILKYNKEHPEIYRKACRKRKLKALQIVSGLEIPKCINCGCSDFRILEINHKNLGGYKESKRKGKRGGAKIYSDIILNRRGTNDLEVVCKLCNWKHYIEKKYALLFKVIFLGEVK